MQQHVNAYTLAGRTPRSGITVMFPKPGHPEIRLGNAAVEGEYERVPLGLGGEDIPWCVSDQLQAAQTGRIPGDRQIRLVHHKGWRGILVRIIARDLDFGLTPIHTGLTFWPGGEGYRHPPMARFGAPSEHRYRDELFAIGEKKSIFVGDTRGAIIVLSCHEGTPKTRPAGRDEVLQFIYNYGMDAHHMNTGAIRWALRNLFTLGALSKADELGKRAPSLLTAAQRERLRARSYGT